MQAFKGQVAGKEQQVKEAAQAGKVALLEGQVASNSKTVQVSTSNISWHRCTGLNTPQINRFHINREQSVFFIFCCHS